MTIENLKYDNFARKISWEFDGAYTEVDNAEFATVHIDRQRNKVCGISRERGKTVRLTYYSNAGKKEFDCHIPQGEIITVSAGQERCIYRGNIKTAEYYPAHNMVLIGANGDEYALELIGLTLSGETLFAAVLPDEMKLWYFGLFGDMPNVACIGGEDESAGERSGYWYEVRSSGELVRRAVVY